MKKTLRILLLMIIVVSFCFINYSFAEETSKTLSSISVTTEPTVTEYTEGESFDPTGMVVTATYSDNTTKEITDYTYYPNGALTINDDEVEISYTENDVTETTTQEITVKTALKELVLNYTDITLALQSNETWGLVVQANPANATLPEIVWSTSNENVVTVTPGEVDSSATLEAIAVGEATITAQTVDGKYSAVCNVTVTDGTMENVDTTDKNTTTNNDNTTKTGILPNTGLNVGYIFIILIVSSFALVSYLKHEKYKGI